MKADQGAKRPTSSERLNFSKCSSRSSSIEDYLIAQSAFPDFFYQKNEDGRLVKGWKKNDSLTGRESFRAKQSYLRSADKDLSILEWYRKEYGMK